MHNSIGFIVTCTFGREGGGYCVTNNGGDLESKSGSVCTQFSYINNVLHEVEDPTYCIANTASSNSIDVTTTCTGQYIFELSGSSYRIKTSDNSQCWGLNVNKIDLVAYPGSCNNFAVCMLFLPLYIFIFLVISSVHFIYHFLSSLLSNTRRSFLKFFWNNHDPLLNLCSLVLKMGFSLGWKMIFIITWNKFLKIFPGKI